MLRKIEVNELPEVWGVVREFIMPAVCRGGEATEESVITDIALENLYLFMVECDGRIVGAGTVAVADLPRKKIATIVHFGGIFDLMLPEFDSFKDWAREQGAEALRLRGRKGWRKRLHPLDFEETYVTMECRL